MSTGPSTPTSPQPQPPAPEQNVAKPAVKEPREPVPQQAQQSAQGEYGEGNYKAARDYDDGVKRHLATHDVEKEARDAAPRSPAEAQDMERAEEAGRARGADDEESIRGDDNA